MSQATLLLRAKLLPPTTGSAHLTRTRLHERIATGLDRRATIILAGPGYGKTTLVARFLEERSAESVWFWLDDGDRDPWVLFQYLIQGIREHVPDFAERSGGLWESLRAEPEAVDQLADVFIRDAEESLGERLLLVLDGVEVLERNPACARAVERLLTYLPGTLHLILVGRSLRGFGLKTLAAESQLNVIQADELLFSPAETRTLLVDLCKLPLQDVALSEVQSRTRGWVTALQLLPQTAGLDPGSTPPEQVFQRTEEEIFEYFSEQVLSLVDDATREFLMSTAPLSVLDAELIAEALDRPDARRVLSELYRQRFFLSALESRTELYAYTPLFRDFLNRKMNAELGPREVARLRRCFGLACLRRGAFGQALDHLTEAGAVEETLDLLRQHGRALIHGDLLDSVRAAVRFLIEHEQHAGFLDDLLGEACRRVGDYAAAAGHFEQALAATDASLAGAARAAALQGLAYSLLKRGETRRAESTAREALHLAEYDEPALAARILNTLSVILYRTHRRDEAIAGWQDALARARQAADDPLTLIIAHNLGLPHAVAGDFRRAAECFRIVISPDNPRIGPEEGNAYLNLARIATLRGEYTEAAPLLDDAWEISRKWKLRTLSADVLEVQGNLLRETGDHDGAAEKYAAAHAIFTELGLRDLLENLAEEEALLAARRGEVELAERLVAETLERARQREDRDGAASALLAQGEILARSAKPGRALEPLEQAAAEFSELKRAYEQCVAQLWLAVAWQRDGKPDRAQTAARRALRLSSEYDYAGVLTRVADLAPALREVFAELPDAPPALAGAAPAEAAPTTVVAGDGYDLRVRLLGPVEVYRDRDRKIPAAAWKVQRALKVFCFLAASRGQRATKDRIVDAVWGDARLSVIEKNFHPTISFLRRALNHGHRVTKNFVRYEAGGYVFNPAYRYWIDTLQFEEHIRAAREHKRGTAAIDAYEAALALYAGSFLEEHYDEWIEAPRTHFETLHHAARSEVADLHLEQGTLREAGDHLQALVDVSPIDEEASARLMTALGRQGLRGAVEREYERLRAALDDALATSPKLETRRAYRDALNG